MAQKKSFKADLNPAMQFISPPADETPIAHSTPHAPQRLLKSPSDTS